MPTVRVVLCVGPGDCAISRFGAPVVTRQWRTALDVTVSDVRPPAHCDATGSNNDHLEK